MDEVNGMDRRKWKNFILKRSTLWTLSLCMTGAIVLGSVAAVNRTRQEETQTESELADLAYLEQESETAALAEASGNAVEQEDLMKGSDLLQEDVEGLTEAGTDAIDGAGESVDASVNAAVSDQNVAADDGGASEVSADTVISEQALLDQGIAFSEEETLMWPSAGTILIDYSMDGSVYFPTLNQYKYNPALIIGSETGNQVLAAAKGMVESVTVDEETGTTLVLNIGNGYKLTYGQLKELAAGEGDIVEEGSVLGYVSEPTKYFSEEGSNLYFKMTKDDAAVDPVLFLE